MCPGCLRWWYLGTAVSACALDPESAKQKYFARAEQYFLEKKSDEAIVEYRNALQRDPKFADARFKLGEAYVAKNDYRNAYPEYIRAADLKPDDLAIQARAGNILLLGRRFDDARTRARAILKIDPSNLEALILLGNALAGLGDLPSAVEMTERAAAEYPNREGIRVNLGALQLAGGNQQEAEEAFTAAVRLNPKSLSAHLALANFYHHQRSLAAAEDSFKRALALAPDDIRTNRAFAGFLISVGRPEGAEFYLRSIAEKTTGPRLVERFGGLLHAARARRGCASDSRRACEKSGALRQCTPAHRRHRAPGRETRRGACHPVGPALAQPGRLRVADYSRASCCSPTGITRTR